MKRLIFGLSLLLITMAGRSEEIIPVTYPGDVDHLAFRTVERRENGKLKLMLREGLSPHLRANDGTTLLMYAALHGDAEGVRLLLEAGANPNAANDRGATALIWGAVDVAKVRLLVEHGAQVNGQSKDAATPLAVAASYFEGAASVAYLLKAGADISAAWAGHPPLEIAASAGSIESVKTLLEFHSRQNQAAPDISRALRAAVAWDNRDIAIHLIKWTGPGKVEFGRDEIKGIEELALKHPDLSLAKILAELGAPPPGLVAATYSDVEDEGIVKGLIERGADLHARGFRDYSALDYARLRGHRGLEKLLLAAGVESGRELKRKIIPQNGIRLEQGNEGTVVSNSVARSLGLMLKSSDTFLKNRTFCTSCHHQDLPSVAASIALSRGIATQREALDRMNRAWLNGFKGFLDGIYSGYLNLQDVAMGMGYELWGRSALGLPPDPIAKAVVWFLAGRQQSDGHWPERLENPRMPLQDGAHQMTALGLRALRMYPLAGREAEFAERIQRARLWLERTPTQTHTERSFRLLGLAWAGADPSVLRKGIDGLLDTQNADGGWSQLKKLESDAWATGLALLVVQAAGLETAHPAYRRGMEFLLNTQFEDGSWFVRTRSEPVQPHFDSHFPFGWDQWISAAGTAVASASLALALDPVEMQVPHFSSATDILRLSEKSEKETAENAGAVFDFHGAHTVDFQKEIRPLLENSCLDCHSGEKPKGRFKVIDRASLTKGGTSGMATFVPGRGAESQLIRHVTDQVEDMEMPPLKKRKTYPALTPAQVQKLITWINEGAAWPEGVVLGSSSSRDLE